MIALWTVSALALDPGRYALVVEIATEARVPVWGHTRVATRSVSLVDLVIDDGSWTQTQRTCAVRIEGQGPARTVMPDALVASLPEQRFPVEVTPSSYVADGGPVTLGSEAPGALPMHATDAGVVDVEGDGHPGATVWLEVPVLGRVDVYIAQRAHAVLRGTPLEGGAEGDVDVLLMEQRTLGASRSMFAGSPPVQVVPGASWFRLIPMEAGAGCEQVAATLEGAVR